MTRRVSLISATIIQLWRNDTGLAKPKLICVSHSSRTPSRGRDPAFQPSTHPSARERRAIHSPRSRPRAPSRHVTARARPPPNHKSIIGFSMIGKRSARAPRHDTYPRTQAGRQAGENPNSTGRARSVALRELPTRHLQR